MDKLRPTRGTRFFVPPLGQGRWGSTSSREDVGEKYSALGSCFRRSENRVRRPGS